MSSGFCWVGSCFKLSRETAWIERNGAFVETCGSHGENEIKAYLTKVRRAGGLGARLVDEERNTLSARIAP